MRLTFFCSLFVNLIIFCPWKHWYYSFGIDEPFFYRNSNQISNFHKLYIHFNDLDNLNFSQPQPNLLTFTSSSSPHSHYSLSHSLPLLILSFIPIIHSLIHSHYFQPSSHYLHQLNKGNFTHLQNLYLFVLNNIFTLNSLLLHNSIQSKILH